MVIGQIAGQGARYFSTIWSDEGVVMGSQDVADKLFELLIKELGAEVFLREIDANLDDDTRLDLYRQIQVDLDV